MKSDPRGNLLPCILMKARFPTDGRRLRSVSVCLCVGLLVSACQRPPFEPGPGPPTPIKGACGFSVAQTETNQTMDAAGGAISVKVTADLADCPWKAKSNDVDFLTVSPMETNGTGTVTVTVVPNSGGERTGTLLIADVTFTVKQSAAACSINPTSQTVGVGGGTGTVAVTGGCAWTAVSSNVAWLHVTSGSSGSGSGSVGFSADRNPGPAARSDTLTIAGQTFTVNQDAPGSQPCTYTLSPATQSVPAVGGPFSTGLALTASCSGTWTASSDQSWLTGMSATSGTTGMMIPYTVTSNPGSQRSAHLTVTGPGGSPTATLTVNQEGPGAPLQPCTYTLTPPAQAVPPGGGSYGVSLALTASCSGTWTAAPSDPSWLTGISPTSGTTGGTINYTVTSNPGSQRNASLLIVTGPGGTPTATLPVTQSSGATYTLSVAGTAQPWCTSAYSIQSNPAPAFGSITAPGPFQFTGRKLAAGTVVQLSGSGAGGITWTNCDSPPGSSVCTVTMNSDHCGGCSSPSPRAAVAQTCPMPSFSMISKTMVSGNWAISFTAVNLVPFDGTFVISDTFTASCPTGSPITPVTMTAWSSSSGTISGTINVPTSACSNGTLKVTDHNGTTSAPW